MLQDPVYSMHVDESKTDATSKYNGQTYYFCSASCKEQFEKDPEQYVKPS